VSKDFLMTQLAFYFDSSACSGCKACQAACKDKNNLPVGLLWRRVYEVTGGGWTQSGQAWTSDVFAYNLSLSCNHCEKPICVEVCPTRAMHQRADGIVVVDQDKCVGCQYCSWACPYHAPQYDRAQGHMTKCDFCADNLAAGLSPACVAACPLRVLDFGEVSVLQAKHGSLASVRPLPDESLTRPSIVIKPHQAEGREGVLGNAEEVQTAHTSERSLIAFTILAQMAVGATWFLSLLQPFNRIALGVIAIIMLAGLLASLLHLGKPLNAWRALRNVRSSWLSREVWCAALFTASLVGLMITGGAGAWLADVIGFALIISMAQVYRLRTVPEWNRWTTPALFFITTLLLGSVFCGALMAVGPLLALGPIGLIGLRRIIGQSEPRVTWLQVAAVIALLMTLVTPIGWWEALGLILIAELIDRARFYAARSGMGAWRFSPDRA
jgi:anaerobic dimethyl sulfoxide reductase subunit B (iron-sulfur subunit)